MSDRDRKTRLSAWKTAGARAPWHIRVAPFRDGWTVGEASLDNAQFFYKRADAEAAARTLCERLHHIGEPCKVSIRLADGKSGGELIIYEKPVTRAEGRPHDA